VEEYSKEFTGDIQIKILNNTLEPSSSKSNQNLIGHFLFKD